jgi:hypothetical protein
MDKVKYGLREYADNPLVFNEVPEWLAAAVMQGKIVPEFRTEDYWYLRVKTIDGEELIAPGDFIERDKIAA